MLTSPYIPRLIEQRLATPTKSNRAEVLLGPRQVGKTTLLEHLCAGKKNIKLTGEDPDDLLTLSEPKAYLPLLQQFPNIIIDEAQYVANIGQVIKRMVDENKAGARIFVTGSSSLDLSGQMKESAAGRFNSHNLWPFSLAELAANSSWIEVKRQIQERMIYGCLPAVINEPERARDYLMDFADTVLYKDLFQLAEVRKPTDLTKLVRYLAGNVGSEIRYATVASELGIQNKTIERYVDLLQACFIVQVVPSLSRNPVSEIKLSKKIYFYDNGIRNALMRDFSPIPSRSDAGALWENLFFTERLKKHAFAHDGGELFFWRTRLKHEVDFLERVDGQISAFECKLSKLNKTTSVKAFERAYPETPVSIVSPSNIDQCL